MFSISASTAEVKKKTVNKRCGDYFSTRHCAKVMFSHSRITIKTAEPLKNKKGKKGKKNALTDEMAL